MRRSACAPRAGTGERCGNRRVALFLFVRRRHGLAIGDALVARKPRAARLVPRARGLRVVARPIAGCRRHANAVDGARCDAQLATRAQRRHDRVHALGSADDRVHRACLDAQRASDAGRFIDDRDLQRPGRSACGIDRPGRAVDEGGERHDDGVATRRATIDVGVAARDGGRVRRAAVVAAAPALRLRQKVVDAGSERCSHDRILSPTTAGPRRVCGNPPGS